MFALLSGSTVECWGGGATGQLDNGLFTGPDRCNVNLCSTTPVAIASPSDATAISVGGYNSSCALLSGGSVGGRDLKARKMLKSRRFKSTRVRIAVREFT